MGGSLWREISRWFNCSDSNYFHVLHAVSPVKTRHRPWSITSLYWLVSLLDLREPPGHGKNSQRGCSAQMCDDLRCCICFRLGTLVHDAQISIHLEHQGWSNQWSNLASDWVYCQFWRKRIAHGRPSKSSPGTQKVLQLELGLNEAGLQLGSPWNVMGHHIGHRAGELRGHEIQQKSYGKKVPTTTVGIWLKISNHMVQRLQQPCPKAMKRCPATSRMFSQLGVTD